jgi:hypothetical protein
MPKTPHLENTMALQVIATASRYASPVVLPGTWKLAAGRAITLEPSEPGVLRVAHGELWATFDDGPHGLSPHDSGDSFYGTGEQVRLQAGERVVVEAATGRAPAYFSWEPAPSLVRRLPSFAAVLQPFADLQRALALAGDAASRLAMGVIVVIWELFSGRDRESVEERACRHHGALN